MQGMIVYIAACWLEVSFEVVVDNQLFVVAERANVFSRLHYFTEFFAAVGFGPVVALLDGVRRAFGTSSVPRNACRCMYAYSYIRINFRCGIMIAMLCISRGALLRWRRVNGHGVCVLKAVFRTCNCELSVSLRRQQTIALWHHPVCLDGRFCGRLYLTSRHVILIPSLSFWSDKAFHFMWRCGTSMGTICQCIRTIVAILVLRRAILILRLLFFF